MEYSQSDIDMMRRDAMRRTREMHSRAIGAEDQQPFSANKENSNRPDDKTKKNTAQSGGIPGIGELINGFEIDSDKLIIIVLIMILAREGTDMKLILALLYIMM